jgi:hypothetical protein
MARHRPFAAPLSTVERIEVLPFHRLGVANAAAPLADDRFRKIVIRRCPGDGY